MSEMIVNKLTGKTSAGDIDIAVGSTTQQLQLTTLKSWLNYNHQSAAIRESFNVSSVTDNATGHLTKNYANNMSVNDHVVVVSGYETGGTGPASDRFVGMARGASRLLSSASQYYAGDYTSPGTARDQQVVVTGSIGDLA